MPRRTKRARSRRASWILPRLTPAERQSVLRAMQDAVATLAREGDARIVGMLAARVWKTEPGDALCA
jgi:hypothetical protein